MASILGAHLSVQGVVEHDVELVWAHVGVGVQHLKPDTRQNGEVKRRLMSMTRHVPFLIPDEFFNVSRSLLWMEALLLRHAVDANVQVPEVTALNELDKKEFPSRLTFLHHQLK